MKIHGQDHDRKSLARHAGDLAAAGGVRLVELQDGVERGIRVLEFRSGSGLAFDVLVDRAMDIGAAEHGGVGFGWQSPTGFRNPGLHEYRDEDGLSWLRSFSGLIVTAGMDHTLFTAEGDASNYHYPPKATTWNGLHGRVANIPAKLIGYGEEWQEDGTCVLWCEGEIRQAAVFGEHLRLRRRIECDLGGDEIRLHDVVTNHGSDVTPHMFLYHINLGWPFLEEGVRVEAPIARTLWQTDSVGEQGSDHLVIDPPTPKFVEQVLEHELTPGPDGRAQVRAVNDRLGMTIELDVDLEAFPAFFEWMHLREGGYALGLEPSTHHVAGEQAARDDGSMIWLSAGESREYRTAMRVSR